MSTFTLTTLNTREQNKYKLSRFTSYSNPAITDLLVPPIVKTLGLKDWLLSIRMSKCLWVFNEMTFDKILNLDERQLRAKISPEAAKKLFRALKEVKTRVEVISEMKQKLLNGDHVYPALLKLQAMLPSQFEILLGRLPALFMDVIKIIYFRIPNMKPDITKQDAQNIFYKLLLDANQCESFTEVNKISLKKWRLEYKTVRKTETSMNKKKSVTKTLWK